MAQYIIEFSRTQTFSVAVEAGSDIEAEDIADVLMASDFIDMVNKELNSCNFIPDFYTTTAPIKFYGDNAVADMVLTTEEIDKYYDDALED